MSILSQNKSIAGYHLGYLFKDSDHTKEVTVNTVNELFRLFNEGALKPQIDSVYPFSKVGEAMQRMHNRQNVGKVLLKPDQYTNEKETTQPTEEKTE